VLGLILIAALLMGCNGTLDSNVATLNAAATAAASGNVNVPIVTAASTLLTPAPTTPPNLFDLTTDPSASLAHAWGQTYGLGRGAEFTIVADEAQASQFVIETLQLGGWQDSVRGGSVALGVGQVRLDVALILGTGDQQQFGSGTVTFQPTLDGLGRLRLNPQGAQFGQLTIPDNLTSALGDSIYTLLTGARNDSLSRVNLTQITLENGVMRVSGTVR
jgi:hypothetical protein